MAEKEKKMSVAQMREILKAKGVKNTSIMRKAELQERMAALGLQESTGEIPEKVQTTASESAAVDHEVKSENTENKKPYVFRSRAPRTERASLVRTTVMSSVTAFLE